MSTKLPSTSWSPDLILIWSRVFQMPRQRSLLIAMVQIVYRHQRPLQSGYSSARTCSEVLLCSCGLVPSSAFWGIFDLVFEPVCVLCSLNTPQENRRRDRWHAPRPVLDPLRFRSGAANLERNVSFRELRDTTQANSCTDRLV